MINQILTEQQKNSTSPILRSLGINNSGVDLVEENLRKEYEIFLQNFTELGNITENDKIGRDKKKYYLFQSGLTQKAWRLWYGENREWTFKYLDEDFTEFMRFLDKVITQKAQSKSMGMKLLISDLTKFIDNLMPGLYNLKKTYPNEKELVAKIDSIIVTLIDFKDKTRDRPEIKGAPLRYRALSE